MTCSQICALNVQTCRWALARLKPLIYLFLQLQILSRTVRAHENLDFDLLAPSFFCHFGVFWQFLVPSLSVISRNWREWRCLVWWKEATSWKREYALPERPPRGPWQDSAWTASRRAPWTKLWGPSSSLLWSRSCLRTNPGLPSRGYVTFVNWLQLKQFFPSLNWKAFTEHSQAGPNRKSNSGAKQTSPLCCCFSFCATGTISSTLCIYLAVGDLTFEALCLHRISLQGNN